MEEVTTENQWHVEIQPGQKVMRVLKRSEDKSAYSYKVKLRK
jgi:hypothetical protein